MEVRYPDIHVQLAGEDWNADSILECTSRALRDGGVGDQEIDAYSREATSRCYNHLLFTTMMWVATTWPRTRHRIRPSRCPRRCRRS